MLFDEVAAEIQGIARRTGFEQTVAVGRLVLDRFFGGSVEAWRERRNHKNNSVRRLALCPSCPLSRSALNQAIGIYAVTLAVPSVLTLRHIEASHVAVVLPLGASEQERWLIEADARQWSVRQLREAVRTERREQGERRGRPRATAQGRALTATQSSLQRLETSIAVLERVALDPTECAALADLSERVAAVRAQLGEVRAVGAPLARESGTWGTTLAAEGEADEEPKIAS